MKLYIPTTSLNFNNILSTESISPKGFYSIRGFGYSRWFSIPENDYNGVIFLYESPAEIIRPKSDMEDHPLLIAFETDEDFPIAKEGIRYSNHTIYFNPWNTSFMFQSEKDKMVALSLSDSSLETKMLHLYEKKIIVYTAQGTFPLLGGLFEDMPIDMKSVEHDQRVNKLKGLLYGYYIGACLSASIDDIERLNILREIQNIIAAIAFNVDRTPTKSQRDRIELLFDKLEKREPLYKDLFALVGNEKMADNIVSLLKRYGYKINDNDWMRILSDLKYDNSENNYSLKWIKYEIDNQKKKMSSRKHLLDVDAEEIIISDENVSKNTFIKDIDENALYVTWINDILLQSKYNGNVNSMKKELADVLTKSAISTLGDKWSDSYIRTFLNQLRKHVSGEEFIQPWTNSVLSSIAAVITKGDDWESLLYFMQQKGMTDYRLAFSFYGILNGFANLTRDFTDELFSQDRKYIANVYREFYGQLHGVSINIGSQLKYEANESIYDSNNSKELFKPSLSTLFVEQEGQADSDKVFEEIWEFFGSSAFKNMRKKEELTKGLRLCLENNKGVSDISRIIFDLSKYVDYGWSKNNKPWKTIQQRFCPCYNDSINQKGKRLKRNNETLPLFDNQEIEVPEESIVATSNLFVNDKNVSAFILSCTYLPTIIREKLSKKVISFQKGYAPGGKYHANSLDNPTDNFSTIEHFKRWCFYDKGIYPPIIEKTDDNFKFFSQLKNDLIKRYAK